VGAVDAAALGPVEKYAHGHGPENEKSLLNFGCDFSGWYNFVPFRLIGTKSLKLLPLDVIF